MRCPRLILPPCLLLALASAIWVQSLFSQGPARVFPEKLPTPQGDFRNLQLQGAGSCASMACHNADAMAGARREYGLALKRDPQDRGLISFLDKHVQAHAVLYEERSKIIAKNYFYKATTEPSPHTEKLCLSCHVHPAYKDTASPPIRHVDGAPLFRGEEGVSCEACHGPAERWLSAHFRPGWQGLSPEQKYDMGMLDMRNLETRIKSCLDCHVGTPGMEVNHDLIAAGHPRLNFEFSTFHALWHKHWDPAQDKEPGHGGQADFETRAWVLGQVYAARAALKLLEHRAGNETQPWPEFAEHDCFACHHDLQSKSPRQRKDAAGGGALPWSSWYYNMLPSALASLEKVEGTQAADVNALLNAIGKEMAKPLPNRKAVAANAGKAAVLLGGEFAKGKRETWDNLAKRLTNRILPKDPELLLSWDDTAQGYLALSALDRGRAEMKLPPLKSLGTLPEPLRFPKGYDSPDHYDPQAARRLLNELKQKFVD